MRRAYRQKVSAFAKLGRYRSAWRKLVRFMACIVVFCTTYALILPAITMEQTYDCGMEAHEHTEDCYIRNTIIEYICTPQPDWAHTHSQLCYDEVGTLVCPMEERDPHIHQDSCFGMEENPVCGQTEEVHCHDASCVRTVVEDILLCTQPEHIHGDQCHPDPDADLESPSDWENTMSQLELTGEWSKDLITVAQSQIGYAESDRNYILDGGTKYGYSRYGQWYGAPYGRWDAMFASFCLHYTGVSPEAIPKASDSGLWLETLRGMGLTETEPSDCAGLIFLEEGESVRTAVFSQAAEGLIQIG